MTTSEMYGRAVQLWPSTLISPPCRSICDTAIPLLPTSLAADERYPGMLRTRLSNVGRSNRSMSTETAAAVRICSHQSPGARTATPAAARAPTACMIRTKSSDTTSATASRKARLSQIAQLLSPSQSVKFSPTVYPPSINGARLAGESPPDAHSGPGHSLLGPHLARGSSSSSLVEVD